MRGSMRDQRYQLFFFPSCESADKIEPVGNFTQNSGLPGPEILQRRAGVCGGRGAGVAERRLEPPAHSVTRSSPPASHLCGLQAPGCAPP